MEYLLKASAVIIIFYLCFFLLLKKETFFQHNRWFLLIGLVIALIFPFIVIPIQTVVEPTVISETVYIPSNNIINTAIVQPESQFEWQTLIPIIYSIGLFVLLIQFLFQFGSLILLLLKNPKNREGIYTYVIVDNKISPFSFFKWIVYNPENYSNDELELILMHEKVHVNQYHSMDILFTQLACVIFWFNPLIWLYRKEVRQNLEYIADNLTQTISKDEKEYQRLLLKTSIANQGILLSNNFYNSQIKKRIIMLHKSRSKNRKQWRYLFIVPLLAGLLMSMNTEKVYVENTTAATSISEKTIEFVVTKNTSDAEFKTIEKLPIQNNNSEEETKKAKKKVKQKTSTVKTKQKKSKSVAQVSPSIIGDISITVIDKNTSDSDLDKITEKLKKEGLTIKFKGIKRNDKGEIIAIKIDAKSKKSSTNYQISSDDEAIKPIKIVFDEENNSISIGNGHAKHGDNVFVYETKAGGKHKIHKSGSGSNVFVISDEEHEHDAKHENEIEHEDDIKIIVRSEGEKGKVKKIKKLKNVAVISGDDDGEVIEIIVDEDGKKEKETVIVNGKKVEIIEDTEDINVIGKSKKVWVTKADDKEDKFLIEIDDNKKNIFISDDNGKNPLYIIDGKEVSKDKLKDIDPDTIESINVLKGKNAEEKYGDKGKDGVIIIKTKKN